MEFPENGRTVPTGTLSPVRHFAHHLAMHMTRELVIVNDGRSLDWIAGLSHDAEYVYTPAPLQPGRRLEAESYLSHIVNNYDTLSDTVSFVRGASIESNPAVLQALRRSLPVHGFTDMGNTPLPEDAYGNPNHAKLEVGRLYTSIFQKPPPEFYLFFAGSNFSVNRADIHKHGRTHYFHLLELCSSPLKNL